jgi:hypothetical protein
MVRSARPLVMMSAPSVCPQRDNRLTLFLSAIVQISPGIACTAIDLVRLARLRASLSGTLWWTLILRDVLVAASGTPHDAIRPAHLFDVIKALLVSRKLYEDFGETDRLGMDSRWHEQTLTQIAVCVKWIILLTSYYPNSNR